MKGITVRPAKTGISASIRQRGINVSPLQTGILVSPRTFGISAGGKTGTEIGDTPFFIFDDNAWIIFDDGGKVNVG